MVNEGLERRMGSIVPSHHVPTLLYVTNAVPITHYMLPILYHLSICYWHGTILIDTVPVLFKYMVLGYSYIYRYIQYILLEFSNILYGTGLVTIRRCVHMKKGTVQIP